MTSMKEPWEQEPPAHQWGDSAGYQWDGDTGRDPAQPVRVQPMALGDLIDNAFRLLRADIRVYLLVVGAVIVPTTIVIAVLFGQVTQGLPSAFDEVDPELAEAQFDEAFGDVTGTLTGVFGTALLQTLLLLIAAAGVAWVAARRLRGRDSEAGPALRAGLRSFLPLLGASIARVLVVVLLLAVGGGAAAALVAALGAVGGVIGAVLVLAALAAAVWWYISTALLTPTIVIEGAGAVEALGRSRRLVAGNWWRVFGVLVLFSIVLGLVSGALSFIPAVVGGLFPGSGVTIAVQAVGTIIAGMVTEPVATLIAVLLYADLRSRREGLDVAAQAGLPSAEWRTD